MALAILRFAGSDGGRLEFDVELGSNRYYSYAIGDGEADRSRGIAVLANRKVTSPMAGPLPEEQLGRTRFSIPADQFDKDNRHVQLASFRTANRVGPAVSALVFVPLGAIRNAGVGSDDFPTLSLGLGLTMGQLTQQQPVSFAYRESTPVSQAMFLESLLPMLQKALPGGGSLISGIGSLVGNLFGGGAAKTATAPPSTDDETFKQLMRIIEQFAAAAKGSAAAPTISAPPVGTISEQKSFAPYTGYSQAQVLPLLAAAAPALAELMPMLSKVLTPETMKALIDSVAPDKVIGAVTKGVTDIGKIGQEIDKTFLEHLRALNPGVDDPGLDKLLESMSLGRSLRPLARSLSTANTPERARSQEPMYRRVTSVTVDFTGVTPQLLQGRTRICYRVGHDLAFPVTVTTKRSIQNARVHLLITNPATREIVARQRVSVAEISDGPLSVTPTVSADQLSHLIAGEEYLASVYILWRDKKKSVVGTSRSQLITLVGRYSFDRVDDDGGLVPLNDVTKYRDFWHKAWQGTFTDDFRRASWECKYYFVLEPNRPDNARMETLTKIDGTEHWKQTGRLKTGFVASPAAFNRLLPLVSSNASLDDDELAALRAPDFVKRFQQASRFKADLAGKVGASAALWIYPEVKVQKIGLYESAVVDANGHVQQFAEHVVHFPMPAVIHYIGARSES